MMRCRDNTMAEHIIPSGEVRFPFPLKRLDKTGQVFFYNDCVYRGIYPHCTEYIKCALYLPTVQLLMQEQKLVKTTISDKQLEGFSLILQHEHMPIESKPIEWSILTYLTAAKTYLDIYRKLYNNGFVFSDGHSSNFSLMDKGHVIWHDFGSIIPRDDFHLNGLDAYLEHFYYPLMLYKYTRDFSFIRMINFRCSKDNYYLIRRPKFFPSIIKIQQLNNKLKGNIVYNSYKYTTNKYFNTISMKEKLRLAYTETKGKKKTFNEVNKYIDRLQKDISDINIYHNSHHIANQKEKFDIQIICQQTINRVIDCINSFCPKSIIDLGGHLSYSLGTKDVIANKLIAILHDEMTSSQCTQKLMGSDHNVQTFPILIQRKPLLKGEILKYQSDVAVSLHPHDYIRIFYLNKFELVMYFFQQMTKKYFITCFDEDYSTLFRQHYSKENNLSLANFIEYLEKYFKNVRVLNDYNTEDNVILLCEK